MSTYTPIGSFTATTSVSSVIISGIPQTYTDLILVTNEKQSGARSSAMRFNSDTGSNYSITGMYGTGAAANSYRTTNGNTIYYGYYAYSGTSNFDFNAIVHINNYSNTTTYKTIVSRANNASNNVEAITGLWRNTAAISSITLHMDSLSDFASGSTFNLYGIDAQASAQAKATGGSSITTDGTYWYHTFNSSGTFTPTQALTADYLVVAGGGGGGFQTTNDGGSGGGGAGGLRSTVTATGGGGSLESALSLTAQAYTVTVGAGGSGSTTNAVKGTSGSNSVFSTITSTGGGGGGSSNSYPGASGGSGGGGAKTNLGGSGTANEGYAGGRGLTTDAAGGGGGGAGAVGSNSGGNNSGGAGGSGVSVSITGSSVTYAGGGGGGGWYISSNAGGAGGSGGGGAGGAGGGNSGNAGTANRGGGGGGAGGSQSVTANGGSGGSGIVIIRYAV